MLSFFKIVNENSVRSAKDSEYKGNNALTNCVANGANGNHKPSFLNSNCYLPGEFAWPYL